MSRPIADLLAEAEALDAAATPGKWTAAEDDVLLASVIRVGRGEVVTIWHAHDANFANDAAFIARARSLVPELAAALKAVAAERDALKAASEDNGRKGRK